MLTSNSVDPNVLPGICKTLELYILVYELDKLTTKGTTVMGGARDIASNFVHGLVPRAGRLYVEQFEPGTKQGADAESQRKAAEEMRKKKDSDFNTGIDYIEKKASDIIKGKKESIPTDIKSINVNVDNITISPTWVTVSSKDHETKIVGIKVVPYTIDDTDIVNLLLYDSGLNKFETFVRSAERKISRTVVNIWHKTAGALLAKVTFGVIGSGKVLTGNPKDDIILQLSDFKNNVFVMLNSMSIPETFAKSVPDTRKLFKLGWSHILINDDISQKTTFCMKQFNGVCSTISQKFIYSSMGKGHKDVFEDMSDIKKAASPIFRLHTSSRMDNLVKHEGIDFIKEEEIQDFTKMLRTLKTSDYDQIVKDSKKETVSYNVFEKMCREISENEKSFEQSLKTSKQVLNNSLTKIPDTVNDVIACVIALRASRAEDPKAKTKEDLNNTVDKIRS